MFDLKFNLLQQVFLCVGQLFIVFSIFQFCFFKNKYIAPLLIGAFFLSLFAITLDPFLNSWDEQYHALVGKNLSSTPFHPRLFPDPALPYSHEHWTLNYTWLHKQPWFMWQMALFIKLFGTTELIIRIPSLICFIFATYCIYKIGKNICNVSVGYLSALLWTCNYFFYALMSGGQFTDQNDIVFISFTTISIWAFTEYVNADNKTKWAILIGVFAGISVLTKWLSGLIVFSAYGTYTILEHWPKIHKLKNYKYLLLTFLICVIIAGAWQVYIFYKFPIEARFEFGLISKHFGEVVENHGGSIWFYLETFPTVYGKFSVGLFLFGIYSLYFFPPNKKLFFSCIILVLITYTFFTLAKTKMVSFPLVSSSIVIVILASSLFMLINYFKEWRLSRWISLGLISLAAFLFLRTEEIKFNHVLWANNGSISTYRSNKLFWTQVYKNLKAPTQKAALFNCPYDVYIEAMFYSDFISAYCEMPNLQNIETLKVKGYQTCVLNDGNLTNEIRNNKDITIITAPQFHIIKSDTISLLNENKIGLQHRSNNEFYFIDAPNPQKYIVDYFEDYSCSIKLLSGEYLSFNIVGEGLVYAGVNKFSFHNRFYIFKENDGFVSLQTPFKTPINIDKINRLVYGKNKDFRPLKLKTIYL